MKASARRLLLATAGALLLHFAAGVLLWLLPRGQPPRARRRAETISVALRSAPKVAPPAVAPPPSLAPRHEDGLAVRAPDAKGSAPAAVRALERRNRGVTPTAPAEEAPARGTLAWQKAEGLLPDQPAAPALPPGAAPAPKSGVAFGIAKALRNPGTSLGRYAREGQGAPRDEAGLPVRVPTREEALAEEEVRVKTRLGDFLADHEARERAVGVRDAYWQSVEDELARGFEVKWAVRDGDHAPSAARRIAGEVVDQYRRELEAYGKSGSPLEGGDAAPGGKQALRDEFTTLAPEERGLRGTSLERPHAAMTLEALSAAAMGENSPWHTRLVVRILLTQREGGAVESAFVTASSGNLIYDKLALDKALGLGAGGLLGAPPKDHRRSLWAFDTDFLQMPPLPVAGCSFDGFMPAECAYPLKKKVRVGVHLEAVY